MRTSKRSWAGVAMAGGLLTLLGVALTLLMTRHSEAGIFKSGRPVCPDPTCVPGLQLSGEPGGTWYWMRSPEEERRVISGLYNRYCIRCHGVDGRGVWDIPDVPDFTDARWQACRSDGQIARAILEGRGAVMPPFRGALTLEEAWAMARYLRTFVPGTEASRADRNPADNNGTLPPAPAPKVLKGAPK
jgi:hypothetical protein